MTLRLRHLDCHSPIHRMRADVKIAALLASTTAVALDPSWPVLAAGWAGAVAIYVTARLPRNVLGAPPTMLVAVLGFSFLFALFSGGDPTVGGIALGGVVELAQLVAFGVLLVAMAAILAWTTPLSEIGFGLARLLAPLRLARFPVEELATVVVLAIRTLPAVSDELSQVLDARRTRPEAINAAKGFRAAVGDAVDIGATVVVGSHRRAHDLGRSMLARGTTIAPRPRSIPFAARDALGLVVATLWAATVIVLL